MNAAELAAHLFQVQEVDLELDHVQAELQTLVQTIEGSARLQKLRSACIIVQQQVQSSLQTQKEAEWELEEINRRLQALEKRLATVSASRPEELQLLQREIQQLRAQQSRQEEKTAEVADAAEALQELAQRKLKDLQQAEEAWQQECTTLIVRRDQLIAQQQELQAKRSRLANGLEHDLLHRYDLMRRTKQGRAVSKVEDNSCQWCLALLTSSELQQVLAASELQTCTHCGRILYYDC